MSEAATRHFASLGPGPDATQFHYRRMGEGPPLLALHASPLHSEFMLPAMAAMSAHATVIAPDTLGYGLSDPAPEGGSGLEVYVQSLIELLDALGLPSAGVYGTATGAQIAIELARSCPERVDFVILDNVASFDDADRQAILEGYFAELKPTADGAHLARAWNMARGLYSAFPWYSRRPEAQLTTGMPPLPAVQAVARATLGAGAAYDRAYRAAFFNEESWRVREISVPVSIIRWEGSLLRRWSEVFDRPDWPEHIRRLPCGPSPQQRLDALGLAAASHCEGRAGSVPPASQPEFGSGYLATEAGPLYCRQQPGSGLPLLLLHPIGSSAAAVAATVAADFAGRQLLLPDLPGHGASAQSLPSSCTADDYALLLEQAVSGQPALEIVALDTAAPLAEALARRLGKRCRGLHLPAVAPDAESLCAAAAPDLSLDWGGGHWQRAWHAVADSRLFRPAHLRDATHRRKAVAEAEWVPLQLQLETLALIDSAAVHAATLQAFAAA